MSTLQDRLEELVPAINNSQSLQATEHTLGQALASIKKDLLELLPDKDYRFDRIDDFHEAVEEMRTALNNYVGEQL